MAVYSQPHTTENVLELVHFEDLPLGTEWRTRRRTITAADMAAFVGLSGDFNPLYTDAEHARAGHFGEPVVPGALIAAVTAGLGAIDVPVPATVGLVGMNWRFLRPVRPGDTISSRWRLNRKRPVENPRWGLAVWQVEVENQRGEVVAVADVTRLVSRREQPEAVGQARSGRRRRRRAVAEIAPGGDLPSKPRPGPLQEPLHPPVEEVPRRAPQPAPEVAPEPVVAEPPRVPDEQPAGPAPSSRRRRRRSAAAAEPAQPRPEGAQPPAPVPAEPEPAPAPEAAPARSRRRRPAAAPQPAGGGAERAEPPGGEPRPPRRRRRSRQPEPAATAEQLPLEQVAAAAGPAPGGPAPANPAPPGSPPAEPPPALPSPPVPSPPVPPPAEPPPAIPSPFRPPAPRPQRQEESPANDGSGGLAGVLRRLRGS